MDYALYDLFNGSTGSTVHTRAGFVKAVDATTVDMDMKGYAINFQDAVWDHIHIARTVTQVGSDLEFTVRGGKLTAEIELEPTSFPVPPDLRHSQFGLQNEIAAVQNNYVGAGVFWIENLFYKNDLRLGATAVGDGNGVLTTVYGPHLTALITVAPTIHLGTASS